MFQKIAVLGSGTMGSQIAVLLASHGFPCLLFDIKSENGVDSLAQDNISRLFDLNPSLASESSVVNLISPLNYDEHLELLSQADWVIEAVSEDLTTKIDLWKKVSPHLNNQSIISTNTSGLSIENLASSLPRNQRGRFLGTHFFNPPQHLKLLELIPSKHTDKQVVSGIKSFCENSLDRGIVLANDVPGFVANRIGCYGLLSAIKAIDRFDFGFDQADLVTGPLIGRPKSATFRTLDLIGLDIFQNICQNIVANVANIWEKQAFKLPEYIFNMIDARMIGQKCGQGFFKKVEYGNGHKQILCLDKSHMEYVPTNKLNSAFLTSAQQQDSPVTKISAVMNSDDPSAQFAKQVVLETLWYAANKVGEITNDISGIDNAMKWGFGWELGPFEIWDSIGVEKIGSLISESIGNLPEWVQQSTTQGRYFYLRSDGKTSILGPSGYREL